MGSAALIPQVSGHVVNVLRVFGRTVVFDMIHADGPTFNLTANTTERRVSLANESNETHTHITAPVGSQSDKHSFRKQRVLMRKVVADKLINWDYDGEEDVG